MTGSSTAVGDTSIGWKQRGARAGLYQLQEPIAHTGSLKLAKAELFTPRKLVNAVNQPHLSPPHSPGTLKDGRAWLSPLTQCLPNFDHLQILYFFLILKLYSLIA